MKRNPLMVGGGVLFAAVAMFTGALLLNARGERRAVVVSAREIPAGTVIQTDMLRIEYIEADTQLPPLWSSSKAEPDEERAVSAPRGTHGRIRFFDGVYGPTPRRLTLEEARTLLTTQTRSGSVLDAARATRRAI